MFNIKNVPLIKKLFGNVKDNDNSQLFSLNFNNPLASGNYQLNTNQYTVPTKELKNFYKGIAASCIDFRGENVAKANPMVVRQVTQTRTSELDQHKFMNVLRNPNPYMSFDSILEYTSKQMDIYGNSYWYIVYNKLNEPLYIYTLPSDEMEIYCDKRTGAPLNYVRKFNSNGISQTTTYEASEIIHYKTYNPFSQHYGLSIIQKGIVELTKYNMLSLYQTAFLNNDGTPKMAISGTKRKSQEDFERLQKQYKSEHSGALNGGNNILWLEQGQTVTPIQMSMKDMDYINSATYTEQQLMKIFRVPSSALGTGDSTNKSTAQVNMITFYHSVIQPILTNISGTLNLFIRNVYSDPKLSINFELPLPTDPADTLKETTLLLNSGAISLNEARSIYNYDTEPQYDKPISKTITTQPNTDTGGNTNDTPTQDRNATDGNTSNNTNI